MNLIPLGAVQIADQARKRYPDDDMAAAEWAADEFARRTDGEELTDEETDAALKLIAFRLTGSDE
jgi:hypothetical protein